MIQERNVSLPNNGTNRLFSALAMRMVSLILTNSIDPPELSGLPGYRGRQGYRLKLFQSVKSSSTPSGSDRLCLHSLQPSRLALCFSPSRPMATFLGFDSGLEAARASRSLLVCSRL